MRGMKNCITLGKKTNSVREIDNNTIGGSSVAQFDVAPPNTTR